MQIPDTFVVALDSTIPIGSVYLIVSDIYALLQNFLLLECIQKRNPDFYCYPHSVQCLLLRNEFFQ